MFIVNFRLSDLRNLEIDADKVESDGGYGDKQSYSFKKNGKVIAIIPIREVISVYNPEFIKLH